MKITKLDKFSTGFKTTPRPAHKEVIMANKHQNFHIRMDKDLHSDLKELSEKEHRSLSAQIQLILSQYVEKQKQQA